jgi:hypothetical protein
MTRAAVIYDGVDYVDGHVVSFGAWRRIVRFVATNLVLAIAAVAAVALFAVVATVTAAWLVNTGLDSNSQLHTKAYRGPRTLALAYDPHATGSTATDFGPQWARSTGARPLLVEVPQDRIQPTIARADRRPPADEAALKIASMPAIEQVADIPLPRAHPAPQEFARAIPKAEPKTAQQVASIKPPPAPAVAKPAIPQSAPNKVAPLPEADNRTAVYDIAAHTVYMPDGQKLEAHSGLGDKRDDPRYFKVRMRGPTPPNVYTLTMREKLFHGVRAIRLNPVDEDKMHGRDGMLAHTYMLGPNGQSNGCVSFKDYRKFLTAFLDGKVDRLVVVPELGNTSWRTAAREGSVRPRTGRRYAANTQPAESSFFERIFTTR